jgi:glycosyltransferase involved in cell wall biosynthesis
VKVLHLDTGNEWRGGQQQVFYLTQGLEERGIVSVVASPQGSPLATRLRRQDLPVIELPLASPFSPRMVRSLQHILADRTWHVVHAHTAHAHTLAFLSIRLPPARPFHRPEFVISRRVDFVPARDPLTRLKYTTGGQTYLCVSHAIAEILRSYGVPSDAVRVVHSGVPLPGSPDPTDPLPTENDPAGWSAERRDLREELGVPPDGFLLGNVAQFVEHKGHRFLLDALERILRFEPGAHLVLLGSGELEKDLRKQAERLGLARAVTFAGFRPDVARYLSAMDVFTLSSVEEGLGTSILDAQAAGVPVVGTRAGGMPEAVREGESGLLVPTGDPEALANAILHLLRDPVLRTRMGRAGRAWVRENFSTGRMVEQTLTIYREIQGRA